MHVCLYLCVCNSVREGGNAREKTDPLLLLTRGGASRPCLKINRKYLTVQRKLFEVLHWHHVYVLQEQTGGHMCHSTGMYHSSSMTATVICYCANEKYTL